MTGNDYVLLAMYLIGIIPLAIFNYFMPSLLRKNVFFGVTVPSTAKKEPELKLIEKNYRRLILIGLIIITLVYGVAVRHIPLDKMSILYLSLIMFYIAFMYLAYLQAWRKTKQIKTQKKWDVESKNITVANLKINTNRIRLNPKWFISYILLIAFTFYISYKLYLSAPNQIPIRYDFAGNVSAYTNKSLKFVYIGLISQIAMAFLMFVVFMANTKAKVDIDPQNIEISSEQIIQYKFRWSVFMFVVGIFLIVITGFMQIAILGSLPPLLTTLVPLVGTVGILLYASILAFKTGQSGSKIKIGTERESEVALKRDDEFWVGGLFYYNKKDPSLFIEKRSGIGYTLNFANRISWVLIMLLIAFLVFSLTTGL